MSNALAIYSPFNQIEEAAAELQKSGYFKDVNNVSQAIVKVLAGAEIGIPPFASMSGIHIIQGKPALGANIIATLVKNDPRYDYRVMICNDTECTLTWTENGKPVGTSSFTIAEAQKAGLTQKDNWRNYPSDMLFARAITRGARRYAPGIFGGSPIYTPDELGADTDEEGNIVIEATAKEAPEQSTPEPINGQMTLEEARLVNNSEGTPYGALNPEKWPNMANSLIKGLATETDPEKRTEKNTQTRSLEGAHGKSRRGRVDDLSSRPAHHPDPGLAHCERIPMGERKRQSGKVAG